MKEKIKIMLVEKDQLFGDCLSDLLQLNADFEITARTETDTELSEYLKQKQTDIVLFSDSILFSDEKNTNTIRLLFPSVKLILLKKNYEIGVLFNLIRETKRDAGMQAS